jgi:hypothetical protein
METRRDTKTGEITVQAKNFLAVISEDGVKIQVGDVTAHEWKFGVPAALADSRGHTVAAAPAESQTRRTVKKRF